MVIATESKQGQIICFPSKYTSLDIQFAATQIQHVKHPKYHLGSIVDLQQKVAARGNLVRKLTRTNWEASAEAAPLALVYSNAEYCVPVLLNSVHTSKIDIHQNNTMRLISGTVESLTQLQWLQQPLFVNW
jgi:hypothetical protein